VPPPVAAPAAPADAPAAREGASLSRELGDLLLQLAIGLHKHAIYPEGHPMVEAAVAAVAKRLHPLLDARGVLSIGVARRQLVIEGIATDPANPVLRELATRLHHHHVGAVKLSTGIADGEIGAMLRVLAADPERAGEGVRAAGLDPAWRDAWPHARLYPLTYGQLELVEHAPDEGAPEGERGAGAATLWIGLARAALAVEDSEVAPDTAPAVVARAIDEHGHEVAYDQVIVGYLLQIAGELRGGGAESEALRRRVSQLVGAMRPETLERLLEMGGSAAQRARFVVDASHALAADAVVSVVEAAGSASGQTISHSLMRLLTKLASHASHGSDSARPHAHVALREQVQRLVTDWVLTDPNPDAYRAALDAMARAAPAHGTGESTEDVEPARLVEMALDLDCDSPAAWRALGALLDRGAAADALAAIDAAPPDSAVARAMAAHIATPGRLEAALASDPPDLALAEWMTARLGTRAAPALLDALAVAERRATRWKLLALLEGMGAAVAPQIAARLPGAPWYVQRNLLLLLAKLPVLVDGFSPAPFVRHEEPRVRREAVRMLLRAPGPKAPSLRAALTDPDEGVVQVGLAAALDGCPPTLVSVVAALAADAEVPAHLRAMAARALGTTAAPEALEALLHVAAPRRTLLGRPRLAPRGPELLAALGALAARWRGEPRADEVLALAARSDDADVRAAVEPAR
jgi:hypothetical protein